MDMRGLRIDKEDPAAIEPWIELNILDPCFILICFVHVLVSH
jgi:hypothetical protein